VAIVSEDGNARLNMSQRAVIGPTGSCSGGRGYGAKRDKWQWRRNKQ